MINTGNSKSRFLQTCLREISFICAIKECEIRAVHIEGKTNRLPDLLSRWNLSSEYQNNFYEAISGKYYVELNIDEQFFRFQHHW